MKVFFFAELFSSVFQSRTVLAQEIMIFTEKKNYTQYTQARENDTGSYSGPGIPEKTMPTKATSFITSKINERLKAAKI